MVTTRTPIQTPILHFGNETVPVEGSAESLNVGDELELKVDGQAKTAVILNVLPHDERSES